MKKLYAAIIALVISIILTSCSAGSAENTDLTSRYLPEGAEFINSEKEDGFTEYKYRTDTGDDYSLLVDSSDNVRALKYDAEADSTAEEITISSEEAFAKIIEQYPEAQLITAIEDNDDGRWEWNILFSADDILGFYELDAANGLPLEYTIFYGLSESIDPASLITANISDARITAISLETDDGRLIISGNAVSSNGNIDFTIDAASGTITKFEFDD